MSIRLYHLPPMTPLFEGRQHPRRPDRRVRPLARRASPLRLVYPVAPGLPPVCSIRSSHRVSTFLHPFAPPALPGFIATMSALTPARGRACGLLNLAPSPLLSAAQVSPLHVPHLPSSPSPTTSPLPRSLYHLSFSVRGFPLIAGLGFATPSQARQTATAESSSSSYGLLVRLALLPTPPRG